RRRRRDPPRRVVADGGRLRQEVEPLGARREPQPPSTAPLQQVDAGAGEAAVEGGEKLQRVRDEHLVLTVHRLTANLNRTHDRAPANWACSVESRMATVSLCGLMVGRTRSNIEWFRAWKPASVMNWTLYPMWPSSRWNLAIVASSRCRFQLNDGE